MIRSGLVFTDRAEQWLLSILVHCDLGLEICLEFGTWGLGFQRLCSLWPGLPAVLLTHHSQMPRILRPFLSLYPLLDQLQDSGLLIRELVPLVA